MDSMFDVEKGVGTIVIAKPLDAEQRSFYNLTVEVTDGTNIAYTQVNTHTHAHTRKHTHSNTHTQTHTHTHTHTHTNKNK